MPSRRRRSGFTIIEFAVTLAIMGLLLAMGIPSLTEWIANSRIRTTADSIADGLRLARAEAIRSNSRIAFRLNDADDGGWRVIREEQIDGQPRNCEFTNGTTVQESVAGTGTAATAFAIYSDVEATTPTGARRFIFGPNGWQGCTAIAQFQSIGVDSTSLGEAASRNLRVIAPPGGAIRLCDPNVGESDVRACPGQAG